MSNPKFAPGPFEIEECGHEFRYLSLVAKDGFVIAIRYLDPESNAWGLCTQTRLKHHQENRKAKANMALLKAAPDLYEALKEIVAISDRKHDAWDRAKAAIAKAEGRPS